MLKSTPVRIVLGVAALAVILVVAVLVFDIDPEAWMSPTEAQTAPAALAVDAPAADAASNAQGAEATAEPTAAATDTAPGGVTAAQGPAPTAGPLTFTIDQSASEARFVINEVLVGIPTEVTGVTSLISGTVTVDPADPSASQVETISVDANDLRTDRNLRNRAIRRFILESGKDEYRYITFTPTAISGLPEQAEPGDSFTFQVSGDLKIKDVTQPVTFDVELTADSATQISGLATAVVKRSDFNLEIPSAPGVADVTDEVRLELAFTAKAQ